MDTLSHFLWALALYWQDKRRWLAGLIGAMPDLLSFGIYLPIRFFSGTLTAGKPELASIPQWVHLAYDLTHSLVVFLIVAGIVYYFWKEWALLLGGWPLHIIMDIPTHSREFFPTPFLWPISDVTFNGISWATAWFMIANYSLLAIVFTTLVWKFPRIDAAGQGATGKNAKKKTTR